MPQTPKTPPQPTTLDETRLYSNYRCAQCGRDMGFQWFLGPVCGACCRRNHRRVTGQTTKGKRNA